jgi:hypothetical protein
LVHEVLLREVLLGAREGLGIGQYRGKWGWGEWAPLASCQ